MKGIKLYLNRFIGTSVSNIALVFSNITNLSNHTIDFVKLTMLQPTSSIWVASYQTEDGVETTLSNTYILDLSATQTYIIFDADINNINLFNSYIEKNIIELVDDNITSLICYTQNSENDVVNKSITPVTIIHGKFNHSISVKNVNIDLLNYQNDYNYVYIPKLKRYYYVDSIEVISADYTRLHLKEDVLMTWKELILDQTAYINRNENGKLDIEDSRRTSYLKKAFDIQTLDISVFLPLEQGSVSYDWRYVLNVFD